MMLPNSADQRSVPPLREAGIAVWAWWCYCSECSFPCHIGVTSPDTCQTFMSRRHEDTAGLMLLHMMRMGGVRQVAELGAALIDASTVVLACSAARALCCAGSARAGGRWAWQSWKSSGAP